MTSGVGRSAAVMAVLVVLALLDAGIGTAGPAGARTPPPPVLEVGREGQVTWVLRSDARRRLKVTVADELALSLGAGPDASTCRSPRRRRPRRHPHPPGDAAVASGSSTGSRSASTADSAWGPAAVGALATVLRVHPAFRRGRRPNPIRRARILEVGLRSARGLGGGPSSSSSASTAPTTSSVASTGPDGPGGQADRARTYRAERNQASWWCSTTVGSWRAGWRRCPGSSTPWTLR